MTQNTDLNLPLFERAKAVIPGGVNSPVRAFNAVGGTPRFVQRAQGAYIWDAEGAFSVLRVTGGGGLGLAGADGHSEIGGEEDEQRGLHEAAISASPAGGVKRSAHDQPDRGEGRQPGQHGLEGVLLDPSQDQPAQENARDRQRQQHCGQHRHLRE